MTIEQFFCDHPTIEVRELDKSNTAYISCKKCLGFLTEYKTDIPESRNFDLMLARRLYVIRPVHKWSEEQLKKWV